jgi:oxygen-independent coproporphyrinogen III oxidase
VQAKHGQLSELPEDDQATLFDFAHRFLADAGWPAYEVSNFARAPVHQSRHNRKYWDHTPYLGLGPSAHSLAAADASFARRGEAPPRSSSRVRLADASGPARRWWNERGTPRWERRLAAGERPIEGQEILGVKDLAAEALLLGLRTTAGIDLDSLRARYGVDLLAANDALVARLVDEGRIVVRADAEGGRWLVPTLSGLAVADGLAAAFDLSLPN